MKSNVFFSVPFYTTVGGGGVGGLGGVGGGGERKMEFHYIGDPPPEFNF